MYVRTKLRGVNQRATLEADAIVIRVDGHQFILRPSPDRKRLEVYAGPAFITALDMALGADVKMRDAAKDAEAFPAVPEAGYSK